jgi:hypothetical protein
MAHSPIRMLPAIQVQMTADAAFNKFGALNRLGGGESSASLNRLGCRRAYVNGSAMHVLISIVLILASMPIEG